MALWKHIMQKIFLYHSTLLSSKIKASWLRQIKLSSLCNAYQAKQLSRQLATRKKQNQKLPQYQSAHWAAERWDLLKELPVKTNQIWILISAYCLKISPTLRCCFLLGIFSVMAKLIWPFHPAPQIYIFISPFSIEPNGGQNSHTETITMDLAMNILFGIGLSIPLFPVYTFLFWRKIQCFWCRHQ